MSTITKPVRAQDNWTNTDVRLNGNRFTIKATGKWSANPSNGLGLVNADGISDDGRQIAAKDGYLLRDKPESILVGFVGSTPPTGAGGAGVFAIGSNASFSGMTGTLFLRINDDVGGSYGAGYPDNEGTLDVTITTE